MIEIHPAMQEIANSKCSGCEDVHDSLGICPDAVLLRMNAGRWLARGNMVKFTAAKKDYMRHTNGPSVSEFRG